MTTLGTFRSNIAAMIGLDNSTGGDQGLIDGWVNEGYLSLVRDTRSKVQSATFTLTSGSKDYTMDTEVLSIIDVYITSSSVDYSLVRVAVDTLLEYRRNGATVQQSPARYYAYAGGNLLMFYPTPNAADTVTVYYVDRPTALSASSDSPSDVPAEYHPLIEWYALWRAADYDDDASSQQGKRYQAMYEQGRGMMRRDLNLKGGKLPPARVPGVGRRLIPRDNSTDRY